MLEIYEEIKSDRALTKRLFIGLIPNLSLVMEKRKGPLPFPANLKDPSSDMIS